MLLIARPEEERDHFLLCPVSELPKLVHLSSGF